MKSRTRDEASPSFGGYMIRDLNRNTIEAGDQPFVFSLTLDGVERWLRALDLIEDPDELVDRA